MSPPQQLRQQASNCSSLLIYRPREDKRLSWPSWLTYSGWLSHISGHPSATSRAQDSENTSAKDQCYTAGPRSQLQLSTIETSPRHSRTERFVEKSATFIRSSAIAGARPLAMVRDSAARCRHRRVQRGRHDHGINRIRRAAACTIWVRVSDVSQCFGFICTRTRPSYDDFTDHCSGPN